jgi:hypothetical protein
MTSMRRISLTAVLLGLLVGFIVSAAGLMIMVAWVAAFASIDITDVGKNGELVRRASIQLPILTTWLLGLLAAGMTAARVTGGRAWLLHGAIIGGIALLGALAGISARDPIWAIALQLLLTVPVAVAGAGMGPAPRGPTAKLFHRWELTLDLAVFCACTLTLTVYDDVLGWAAFALTAGLLANTVRRRFRGNAAAATAACMAG